MLFYRKEPYASSKYLMDALSVAMNEKLKPKVTHVIWLFIDFLGMYLVIYGVKL